MNQTCIFIITTSIFCTSCTTYNPEKQEPEVPTRWKAAIQKPVAQSQLERLPSSQSGWWRIFQDDDLNYYEEMGMSENLTIQDRVWRLADATASYGVAYSSLFQELILEDLPHAEGSLKIFFQVQKRKQLQRRCQLLHSDLL